MSRRNVSRFRARIWCCCLSGLLLPAGLGQILAQRLAFHGRDEGPRAVFPSNGDFILPAWSTPICLIPPALGIFFTRWWGLTDIEIARLREYLLRGGFLVADDFWGPEQWEVFRQTMARVLPDRLITDMPNRIR